jgi:hypothetical protein
VADVEEKLVAEARAVLGAGEEVLGAGVFGLADLAAGQVVGGTAGALVGATAGDGVGGAIGAFVGSRAAVHAVAAAAGASVQLLVAITPTRIHVLNRQDGGALSPEFASFDRSAVTTQVESFGASRYLTLADTASGESLRLHGSVGWLAAQAKGDKVVLDLLAS